KGRGDDGRDHAPWPRPSDGWGEGEAARGAPRRDQDLPHAEEKQEGPRGCPTGGHRHRRHQAHGDHRRGAEGGAIARTERDARADRGGTSEHRAVIRASPLTRRSSKGCRSSTRTTTRRSAFRRTPRPTTSRRPTESSRASTTRTSTRRRTRKNASRRSTRLTKSSSIPTSESAMTRSDTSGSSSRKGSDVPR